MAVSALRALLKRVAVRGLGSRLVVDRKLRRIAASGWITILNLHRVAPFDRSTYPPLDPGLFDYLLGFVKERFEVVTFAEAAATPAGSRPRLILSFDDGYRDFYDVAAPLLAKHGLRANQNVVPELIETGLPPLNVHVQDFIGQAPLEAVNALDIAGFSHRRPVRSRFQFGTEASTFIKTRSIEEQRALARAVLPQIAAVAEFRPTALMTLDQVKEMAREHEIGAHSFSHASMAFESDDYLRDDVTKCRDYFASILNIPLTVYALPNDSVRPSQVALLHEAGVEHILLVEEDFTAPGDDVYRRFTFAAESRAEVRLRATGVYRWSRG